MIRPLVQATNLSAGVSFTVDFKKDADKKLGRKFFDRKANGVSSSRESPVPK
jgi:hypothetical protein